jgi:hypothetical protein
MVTLVITEKNCMNTRSYKQPKETQKRKFLNKNCFCFFASFFFFWVVSIECKTFMIDFYETNLILGFFSKFLILFLGGSG